jgi:hypothetical protein
MTKEELIARIKRLAPQAIKRQEKVETIAVEYDELTKFPELKNIIVDLLTDEFNKFMSSIDWVAPRPTTFRINLKNGQEFYLIYGKRSWIAQVEGKKYYLLNLPEEERAAEAVSRILRYGAKVEDTTPTDEELAAGVLPPPEAPPTEETPPAEEETGPPAEA